jgi:hypothetical protein
MYLFVSRGVERGSRDGERSNSNKSYNQEVKVSFRFYAEVKVREIQEGE